MNHSAGTGETGGPTQGRPSGYSVSTLKLTQVNGQPFVTGSVSTSGGTA